MGYTDIDLRRDVLLAANKARVEMAPADIATALTDIAGEITAIITPPDPPPDGGDGEGISKGGEIPPLIDNPPAPAA